MITHSLDLDSLLDKSLSRGLRDIAGDTTNLEILRQASILQDGANDRATLLSCGTENSNKLGHGQRLER
jgi:hypothetical protein